MIFTDAKIRSLELKKNRYEVWEDGRSGFGMRVSPVGTKSWLYMFWFEGEKFRMTLGRYPKMTLSKAHIAYEKAKEVKESGINPSKLQRSKNKEERDAATIQSICDDYLSTVDGVRKTAPEMRRVINKEILPIWRKRKVKSISKADITSLLNGIKNRGAPIQANRVQALLHRMFNWAISEGHIEYNPCSGIEKRGVEVQRDRVLSDDEIKKFWHNIDKCSMAEEIKLALKFQLITVQRKGEIVLAKKEEIDLENKVWTIPASNSKNGLAHRVPLSNLAMDIIEGAITLHPNSIWLLASPAFVMKDEPIRARSIDHAIRKNLNVLELINVKPHDLRRTGASNIASLGIPRFTLSRVLNHKDSGPTAVYDRHSYDTEKKVALDTWAEKLNSIVNSDV